MMRLYFAPMEGITGAIYRNAHHRIFGCVDRYYAPFIFTNPNGKISKRDLREIGPQHNEGYVLVPQLLSNCAEDFIATMWTLKKMGYEEVNLNLGCPSNRVASKGRGSGFLARPDELDVFLEKSYEAAAEIGIKLSLKTRVGMNSVSEFDRIMEIYNKYPVEELTIHPRLRGDFYNGTVRLEMFDEAVKRLHMPLCYNGDIYTVADFERMSKKYECIDSWMIGRGLLANPALCREIRGGNAASREELTTFYHAIFDGYDEKLGGNRKVVFLMKEFWHYISRILSDEDRQEVENLVHLREREDFEKKSEEILRNCTIVPGKGYK